jgi:hypothetical protein
MNTKALIAAMLCGAGAALCAPARAAETAAVESTVTASDTIIWNEPAQRTEVRAGENTAAGKPDFTQRELDALLASIALYPDQLLQQILMASTYPLEVVEAARWIERPENQGLTGDRLAEALESQDWDPSVKALAPFPQILKMMDRDLGWMGKLGEAFLAQETEVMDSVQRLRREARDADKLNSDTRRSVTVADEQIIIEPANPDVVYVPFYDPREAYGVWPYPDVPPVYVLPPIGYTYSPGFYVTFATVRPLWGWSRWDWRHRRIHITDIDRYTYHNRGHRPVHIDRWRHDPRHRHVERDRFRRPPPGAITDDDNRRRYRRDNDDGRRFRGNNGSPAQAGLPNVARPLPPTPALAPPGAAPDQPQRRGWDRGRDRDGDGARRQRQVQERSISAPTPVPQPQEIPNRTNYGRVPGAAPAQAAPPPPNAPGVHGNVVCDRRGQCAAR